LKEKTLKTQEFGKRGKSMKNEKGNWKEKWGNLGGRGR